MSKRVALVTGVSRGIGAAIANVLQSHNIDVIGIARSSPSITITEFIKGSIGEEDVQRKAVEAVERLSNGRLDALFLNAGYV